MAGTTAIPAERGNRNSARATDRGTTIAAGFELTLTALVLFAASSVHASFGFGTALVAMPLLILLLGLPSATPLVGFATLTTITIILLREWRAADFAAARQLLLASVPGVPCGIALIIYAPGAAVRAALGAILIAYSVFNLARPRLPELRWPWLVYVFGFISGVLGGAYNTNGPPVVVYGLLARWPPAQFRATLQGFFLPAAVLICATHGASGLWTREVFILYAAALPAMLLGNWLGARLATRLRDGGFTRALHVLLLLLGVLMFV